jgi:ATP-dependent helicase/nuclease subunit B
MSLLPLGLPEPLLSGGAPRLRVIPASAPFLDVLADAMVAALWRKDDPFALADALVLVPNRRSARGLIDAFAKRLGGAALLPSIRPLGDPQAEDDADVWGAALFDALPPPIDKLRRRLVLASLIRRRERAQNGVEDPVRALALADELARLLDSAATVERMAWEKLPSLVQEIDLARHWAASAEFLEIVTTFWPQYLAEQGASDPALHGAALRSELAARWRAEPPTRPIVIAGSTGSQSTTRDLMRAVAHLPRGVVVFPGVDVDLDDESWRLISDQHPQAALKATLSALGVARCDIPALAQETSAGETRRQLVREALAPAEKTADWLERLGAAGGVAFVKVGAHGLRLLEAATEDEEAGAIALMVRETLEQDGATAAVVTPDAGLARRIEAKLARWGVEPSVSHGRRLRETEAGRVIALLCEVARDEGDPVALAALMKHPRVRASHDEQARAALEHEALRGARRHQTLADLEALDTLKDQARRVVHDLAGSLAPLTRLSRRGELTLDHFADALAQVAEVLTDFDIWQGADGEVAARLMRDVRQHGLTIGGVTAYAAPRLLMRLLDEREVPPVSRGDARIAIWGLLEARLQRRDLMILAGLNEGVWPAPTIEDPFLSRKMREELGLPSLDQRIGLAAHDFAQLANAPNVILTRALRRDGAPTLASRWLWRLKTLVQGAGGALDSADQYLRWARTLDRPSAITPVKPPQPRPPAGKRLAKISVTSVETLIRDPYAVYARRILGLEYRDPIDAVAGPAERGTALHAAIERFGDGEDAAALIDLFDKELARAGVPAERRAAEREWLGATAAQLTTWFRDRRGRKPVVYREVPGKLQLGDVTLTGIADRIEIAPEHVAILDFKSGKPPTDAQVESGLSPQLLLEAAMLARGAFEGVPKAKASELVYWRIGNADPTPREVALAKGTYEASEDALKSLIALLGRYADASQPFLSKPRVQFIKPYAEYDHLARRKEWADADGGDP